MNFFDYMVGILVLCCSLLVIRCTWYLYVEANIDKQNICNYRVIDKEKPLTAINAINDDADHSSY